MKIPGLVLSAAVVAVALGLASPVSAQHRRGGGDGGHSSNRGSQNQGTAVPRAARPPDSRPAPAQAPRADNGARRDNGSRADRSPGSRADRSPGSRDGAPSSSPSVRGGDRNDGYRNGGYRNDGYRNDGNRNGGYRNDGYRSGAYPNNGYRNYAYGGYGRRGYYYRAPVRFYRPYYSFRPRFSLSFGLWVGYPVPYASAYYDPFYYGYGYPNAYSYPSTVYPSTVYPSSPYPAYPPATSYSQPAYPQSPYPQTVPDPNSIGVQPGQTNTGGLSFDITPGDAEVLVDGNFVGTVEQFTPSSQPLGLPAGRHQVQVVAPGYRTISFEVNIVAGQVLPYQGTMERR